MVDIRDNAAAYEQKKFYFNGAEFIEILHKEFESLVNPEKLVEDLKTRMFGQNFRIVPAQENNARKFRLKFEDGLFVIQPFWMKSSMYPRKLQDGLCPGPY